MVSLLASPSSAFFSASVFVEVGWKLMGGVTKMKRMRTRMMRMMKKTLAGKTMTVRMSVLD